MLEELESELALEGGADRVFFLLDQVIAQARRDGAPSPFADPLERAGDSPLGEWTSPASDSSNRRSRCNGRQA